MPRVACLCTVTLHLLFVGMSTLFAADNAADVEFFESKIRPVLVKHCYECHAADSKPLQGGLRLDHRAGLLVGGDSGAALAPGDVKNSLLLDALRYESFEMPPTGRLPERVVNDFEKWIKNGAVDPRVSVAIAEKPGDSIAKDTEPLWSLAKPQRHSSPASSSATPFANPLDAFVAARLETAGLTQNPPADRRTLIRRLSFDLVGLPPTPAEVDAFLNDNADDAVDRLITRLLARPQFGERWARLWLDVARYAEDQAHIVGNNKSLFYPNAYLYRDWVINAFNEDMPYDDFVRLQLAADMVTPDDPADDVALGFVGLGPKYYGRGNLAVQAEEWENQVDTVSRGLLGLTVACARCHDHKYDPVSTKDYYALAGVFASSQMHNRERNAKGDKAAKKPEDALHIVREGKVQNLKVMIRGDIKNPGDEVPRRFLTALCDAPPEPFQQGSGRAELAEAIVARSNPLTARVFVNRVWGEMFGRPLVETPSNFGRLGTPPSHPELLDDLAVRFMENGWSLKWLVREIASSATYQQGSDINNAAVAADPANTLLWRMNRRRLSVEAWRDAILQANGRLEDSIGGESIDPGDPQATRRTVYSRVSRLQLEPLLQLFDFPDPNAHAAKRSETTTPLQKLFVMNSPYMVQQAEFFANRVLDETAASDGRIEFAYRTLYSRPPTSAELALGRSFVGTTDSKKATLARWTQYAQVLLAANELLILD